MSADPRPYLLGHLTLETALERLTSDCDDYGDYMEAVHFIGWQMEQYIKEDDTDMLDWLELRTYKGDETPEGLAAQWDAMQQE